MTIHLLAALLWLGGIFFLAVVGAPVLRAVEPPSLRAALFSQLGERFRVVGWAAIGTLALTGTLNLGMRGLLRREIWADPTFWRTPFGQALAWKLGAVALMVGISFLHDFVLGPAASRLPPGSPEAYSKRRQAAWLARINALLGIVLVMAAARLARGG